MKTPELVLRPATKQELPLIQSSWYLSHRQNSALGKNVRLDVYDDYQNALIARLIAAHPPAVVTLPTVPDEVIGWICRDGALTHYCYVKGPYRRCGIGKYLTRDTKFYTHQTRAGDRLARRTNALFNPYLLNGVP